MRFTTAVELARTTATGMAVPPEVVEALGAGRRPAVTVTPAGNVYRSTIASMGGQPLIPVSAEVRGATGVAAGDRVEVEVELDTAPRVVQVPPDLQEALGEHPATASASAALSYSEQRRHVHAVEGGQDPRDPPASRQQGRRGPRRLAGPGLRPAAGTGPQATGTR